MSDNVQKIYELKSIGGDQLVKTLDQVNTLFQQIKASKEALNGAKSSGNDSSELATMTKQMADLTKQQTELITSLKAGGKEMQNMGNIGKSMTTELGASMDKVKGSTGQVVTGFVQFQKVLSNVANTTEEYSEAQLMAARRIVELKEKLSELSGNLASLDTTYGRGAISEDEWIERKAAMIVEQKELNAELSLNNAVMKGNINLNTAEAGSIAEARAQRQAYNKELVQTNVLTEAGRARQQELIALIEERDNFIKANSDKYSQQKINIGNYPDPSRELSLMISQLKGMKQAGLETTQEYIALTEQVKNLKASMDEVNASVKTGTGLSERFSGILERMGLRFIANMVIFQAAFSLIEAVGDKIKYVWDRANIAATTATNINTKAADTYAELGIKMETLRDRFTAVGATMEDKKEVVEELNSTFGDMIEKVDGVNGAEKFFRDKSAAFIQAVQLRATAMGALAVMQDAYKKKTETVASGGKNKMGWFDYLVGGIREAVSDYNLDAIGNNYVKEAIEDEKKIRDIALNDLIEAQRKAAEIDKQYGLSTDQMGGSKKDKAKHEQDLTNKILQELKKRVQFIADASVEEIEQDNIKYQHIFDREEKSYDERLAAYAKYAEGRKRILEIQSNAELDEVQNRLDKIDQLKKKKGLTNEEKSLLTEEGTLRAQMQSVIQSIATKQLALGYELNQGVISITKSSLEQQVKNIDAQLTNDLIAIQDKLNDKLIELYGKNGISAGRKGKLAEKAVDASAKDEAFAKEHEILTEIAQLEVNIETAKNAKLLALADEYNSKLLAKKKELQQEMAGVIALNAKKEEKDYKDRTDVMNEFSSVMTRVTDAFVNAAEQQLAYESKLKENSLNNNKERALAQAQSAQQQYQIEQQFNQSQLQLQRERAQQEKKIKEGQLTMEFSLAEMKAINAAIDPELGPLATGIAITEAAALAVVYARNMATLESASFSSGGYTGDGGKYEPAGIVHRSEFVVNKEATAQWRPLLEAINAGSGRSLDYSGALGAGLKAPVFGTGYHIGSKQAEEQIKSITTMIATAHGAINATNQRIDNLTVSLNPNLVTNHQQRQLKHTKLATL